MNKRPSNPIRLYKYTKKSYAEAMLRGEFYINTFENLRGYEETHSEIGDKDEGVKGIYVDKVDFDTSQPETLESVPDFAKNMIEGPGFKITNGTFIQKTRENFYVFSCSKVYDHEIMKRLDCDTCVQIVDPNKFFREVTTAMQSNNFTSDNFRSGECDYTTERIEHHEKISKIHAAIIKPARYAYQQEVRVIWIPKDAQIKPEKITSKAAAEYIKIITQDFKIN
jgi:hypothetical protein